MGKRLTIGMCCFDDYDGVYFSIQALRLYHQEIQKDIEILVVDNNPTSKHGETVKHLMESIPNGTYFAFDDYQGTSIKNLIFENAKTPYVLSMDSHVFFPPNVLKKLLDFYKKHQKTNDLFQGPLLYDNLRSISTHFEPVWRDQMWGIWATDKHGIDPEGEPFEIPMQGTGVFTCRRKAWLGFNRLFRGFGGEEGYIHEKFRLAGHKTYCLPFLRWMHRFDRPDGVKFPLTWENKVRNYFIGHLELGLDPKPVINHFSQWQEKSILNNMLEDVKLEIMNFNAINAPKNKQPIAIKSSYKPIISCIMPTYNRFPEHQHLVEESIESFLRQDFHNSELIILNDCPGQIIKFNHPRVRIINKKKRYQNLGEKFNVLTDLSNGKYICPWADDDIHLPWRLSWCFNQMKEQNTDYLKCKQIWFLNGNKLSSSIGGFGQCMYTRELHEGIGGYSQLSSGSDLDFEDRAKKFGFKVNRIDTSQNDCYYIYRWGTGSLHLSGYGPGEGGWEEIGKKPIQNGIFELVPHWREDYLDRLNRFINGPDQEKTTEKGITIIVRTVDANNEILPNANYILIAPDGKEIEGTTGDDGTFTYDDMPAGKYELLYKS
jgi:glycosyltransferase involved in cell wall biosynthesis